VNELKLWRKQGDTNNVAHVKSPTECDKTDNYEKPMNADDVNTRSRI